MRSMSSLGKGSNFGMAQLGQRCFHYFLKITSWSLYSTTGKEELEGSTSSNIGLQQPMRKPNTLPGLQKMQIFRKIWGFVVEPWITFYTNGTENKEMTFLMYRTSSKHTAPLPGEVAGFALLPSGLWHTQLFNEGVSQLPDVPGPRTGHHRHFRAAIPSFPGLEQHPFTQPHFRMSTEFLQVKNIVPVPKPT